MDIIEIWKEEYVTIFAKKNIRVGEKLYYNCKFLIKENERKQIKYYCRYKNYKGFMNM